MSPIKEAIEALPPLPKPVDTVELYRRVADVYTAEQMREYALAALRSMPAEPYAYAVYFPDQPTEELVHDLDELLDDMTNREHTITELFTTPPPAPVLSDAEIHLLDRKHLRISGVDGYSIHGGQEFARAIEAEVLRRNGV